MGRIYKTELKRAFTGKRFLVALGIGMVIMLCHLVLWLPDTLQVAEWMEKERPGLYYPVDVFYGWIGANTITWQQYLYFLVLPLLATMPYGTSLFEDRKNGYLKNVLVKCRRRDYYFAKWLAVLLSGGCAAVVPLVLNLLATMAFLPVMHPEAAAFQYGVTTHTMFAAVFYSYPFVYLGIYFLLQFFYAGLFAGAAMIISDFTEYRFVVEAAPLFLYVFFCSFLELLEKYDMSPQYFLNPSYSEMNPAAIAAEYGILLCMILGWLVWKGKRDEAF